LYFVENNYGKGVTPSISNYATKVYLQNLLHMVKDNPVVFQFLFCFRLSRRGTLVFAVLWYNLDNFSSSILVILIWNCGIVVFSELAGYGFLAFSMVLKIILQVLQRFLNLFQFPVGKR